MVIHSCDANVIFNNTINNDFTEFTEKYIEDVCKERIIFFNEVRQSFVNKLTSLLSQIADLIISSVNKTKEL